MSSRILLAIVVLAIIIAAASCSSGSRRAANASDKNELETGRIYGEFEDSALFAKGLETNPGRRLWSAKEVWDGLSGATIQAKTYGRPVPERRVLCEGKVLAYADGFGQYWLDLPPGRYELVGRCRGYRDARLPVSVEAGSIQYLNFYLEPR